MSRPCALPRTSEAPTPGGEAAPAESRRLVVVSHRLPFVVDLDGGEARLRRTVGGLVSGIDAFLRSTAGAEFPEPPLWIGWPGDFDEPADRDAVRTAAAASGAVPAFLEREEHRSFYDGFSNHTLWPLLHTMPSQVHLEAEEWESYRRVNEAFRDAVLSVVRPGDAVWVHDYHLMLLPSLLRERAPDLPIAYFHHVPFPSYDALRVLPDPWARALVRGILGADVAGFHTYDDVRGLLRAAERLLGLDAAGGALTVNGRQVQVDAFPIGVDFVRWDAAADDPEVQREAEALAGPLSGRKVILSVDRLDYTKGILNRLLAFERFLERRPEWRERVTLFVVAAPSRVDVDAYRRMRTQIDEAVGRVNGRFGAPCWTPVVYQYRSLGTAAVAALYLRADVALVTPLRDGMNLVAKEFLATRRDADAVLVLSDTAGAARELGEAVLVNPFHVDGIVEGIGRALEMEPEERARRCRHMRDRIARYDVVRWGAEQLSALAAARRRTSALRARRLAPSERARLRDSWGRAARRLLLLDYDGTLVGFTRDPSAAAPDAPLLRLLSRLAGQAGTSVVIVSGRDAGTLGRWFQGLPISLAAEHGARARGPTGSWSASPSLPPEVRSRVLEVMQVFADRLPGAFVETKEHSLAWHWRAADADVGLARAAELARALSTLGLGPELQMLLGNKVVEARHASAHKGTVARRWASQEPWDVVLAAGDDATDEDLFAALPEGAWSLRVGTGDSRARYNVDRPEDLRALLGELAGREEAVR